MPRLFKIFSDSVRNFLSNLAKVRQSCGHSKLYLGIIKNQWNNDEDIRQINGQGFGLNGQELM